MVAGLSSALPLNLAQRTVPTILISPFLKTQDEMHRFTRDDVKDALIFFRKHQTKTLQSVKNVTKYVHSKLFTSIFKT